MGTYGLEGVIRAWELEKITTEQAIGQILQLIAEIEARVRDLELKYSKINRITSLPVPPSKVKDGDGREPVAAKGNEIVKSGEETTD
jgi:hypothetical protein